MQPTQMVESYRFWDVVSLWGRELLIHDSLVAAALAVGVVRDGLRFQSRDAKYVKSSADLRGEPYVGFSALQSGQPVVLKAEVVDHLFAVVERGMEASRDVLVDEFVTRADFRDWVRRTGQALPGFWHTDIERDQS